MCSMFQDSGYSWCCGVCNKEIYNKDIRAMNRCKKLHFKFNPNCKEKAPEDELRKPILPAPTTIIKGSRSEAEKMDSIMAQDKILEKVYSFDNCDIEYNMTIERILK